MRVSLNAWIYYHGCRNLSSIIFRFSKKFSVCSSTPLRVRPNIQGLSHAYYRYTPEGTRLHFLPLGEENYCVAAVETGGKQ